MKRAVIFVAILLILILPLAANAGLLGTGDLNVTASGPRGGNYYLDYDGSVASSSFGYTTGSVEVFCVSKQEGNGGDYKFYTITSDLDNIFGSGTFGKLSMAAWIADNWTTYVGSADADLIKGEAQKAIWKIMGVMDIVGITGTDYTIYNAAQSHSGYASNWYFAYSPSLVGAHDYQDFITPGKPTPIPAAMWLLGSGLVGLVGIRRRFIK